MIESFDAILPNQEKISVALRHAVKGDIPDLWENFNQVVREKRFIPVKSEVTSEYERSSWFYQHEEDNNIIVVAEVTGKVVGQCVIEHSTWEAAEHVGELGILLSNNYRHARPAIGSRLLIAAIKEARKKDFEKVCLAVFSTNKNAIKSYKKIGFKQVGVRKKQYLLNGKYYDEILMDYFI